MPALRVLAAHAVYAVRAISFHVAATCFRMSAALVCEQPRNFRISVTVARSEPAATASRTRVTSSGHSVSGDSVAATALLASVTFVTGAS
jgi:hypothetical protein